MAETIEEQSRIGEEDEAKAKITRLIELYKASMEGYLAKRSIKRYSMDARQFLEQIGGDLSLFNAVNVAVYTGRYLNELKEKRDVSATTRNLRVVGLKSFASFLVKMKLLESNPLEGFKRYKTPKKLPESLTEEQVNLLLEGETRERNRALLEFMYCTGCREDEVRNMRIGDIDFHTKAVVINGKGAKQRMVILGDVAMEWVTRYLDSCRGISGEMLMAPVVAPFIGRQYLFENRSGRQMRAQDIYNAVQYAARKAGLENVRPHMLRHTFATVMLRRGANIRVIQEFLGHESLNTTQMYLTVNDTDKRDAFDKYFPKRH